MNTIEERNLISSILWDCPHPVIVDLGAFRGEDTAWMVQACRKQPRVIMVEPDPENFEVCESIVQTFDLPAMNVDVLNAAISDVCGTSSFWLCNTPAGRGSGSTHRPTGHLNRNGVQYDFRESSVACMTLDHIFSHRDPIWLPFDHIDMLWVDIQGAERDMIAGGQTALAHTRYIFIEAEEGEEMYADQAMRDELLDLLPGWTEVQRFDFNTLLVNERYAPAR